MKKESKNLGITKACPKCKKMLIRNMNITGFGKFTTKCPHCQEIVVVDINSLPNVTITQLKLIGLVIVILSVGLLVGIKTIKAHKGRVICSQFNSQLDAQNFLVKDPIKYHYLDSNNDGVACQTYKYDK